MSPGEISAIAFSCMFGGALLWRASRWSELVQFRRISLQTRIGRPPRARVRTQRVIVRRCRLPA